MSDWVWVLCPDNGCEGLADPVAAFRTEAEAKDYERHVSPITYRSFKVFRVPLCRFEAPLPAGGQ
jgi:hypothetical protein